MLVCMLVASSVNMHLFKIFIKYNNEFQFYFFYLRDASSNFINKNLLSKKRKIEILKENEKNLSVPETEPPKKIKLFNSENNNNIFYFLKLSNNDSNKNACFCNSVIQALLSLGHNYFDKACIKIIFII